MRATAAATSGRASSHSWAGAHTAAPSRVSTIRRSMLPGSVTTRSACKLPATVHGSTSPLIAETASTSAPPQPSSAAVTGRSNSPVSNATASAGQGERGRRPCSQVYGVLTCIRSARPCRAAKLFSRRASTSGFQPNSVSTAESRPALVESVIPSIHDRGPIVVAHRNPIRRGVEPPCRDHRSPPLKYTLCTHSGVSSVRVGLPTMDNSLRHPPLLPAGAR